MPKSKGRYEVSFQFADATRSGTPKPGWFTIAARDDDEAMRIAIAETSERNAAHWTLRYITETDNREVYRSVC
jgi:hypothetical protein